MYLLDRSAVLCRHSFVQNSPFSGQTELVFGSRALIDRDFFYVSVPCFSSASTIWLEKCNCPHVLALVLLCSGDGL